MASRFRDKLRTGREAIRSAADSSGSGKYVPVFKFDSGETKYLQFVDPIEDWVEVLMHQFMIVGFREDGGEIYERFISNKDPNIDGPDGYDELVDRFGLRPTRRVIALAVEVVPNTDSKGTGRKSVTGYSVAERQYERDGETITVPNVALVIESPRTLFGHLEAIADAGPIEETILGIKVSGKGKDKQFTVIQTNADALDLTQDLEDFYGEFDLDEYLEELADPERMAELVEDKPDDWVFNKFAKKGKDEPKSRRRQPVVDEPDPEPDEEQTSSRTRRFRDMKAQVG